MRDEVDAVAVSDAFTRYVNNLGVDVNEDHCGDWWDGYRQAQRDAIRRATAALESARAVAA